MASPWLRFGDAVEVRSTPETIKSGFAGKIGIWHGFTIPSAEGVERVGRSGDDYAVAVVFDGTTVLFDPWLVTPIDVGGNRVVTERKRVLRRGRSGAWEVVAIGRQARPSSLTADVQRVLMSIRVVDPLIPLGMVLLGYMMVSSDWRPDDVRRGFYTTVGAILLVAGIAGFLARELARRWRP